MRSFFFNFFSFNVVVSLIISFPAFSQRKESKGFYIDLKGDTVKGLFNGYKPLTYNPDKIDFTSFQSGSRIVLTPLNSREVHVEDGDIYFAYRGKRMTNPIEFSNASAGDDKDNFDTITTFLRQIGETDQIKFYVYKDDLRVNLYYSSRDKAITELMQKAFLLNNSFSESMTYKRQLKELFSDATQEERIDNLNYSEESLSSLVNRKNAGGKQVKKVVNKNDGLFIVGGGSLNSFKYNGERSINISEQDYPSHIVPVVGLGYIFSLQRSLYKLFVSPQVKIFSFKHSISTVYNNSFPVFTNTFQSSPAITLGVHVGYNILNTDNVKASIAPGVGFTMLANNRQIDESRFSSTDSKTTVTPLSKVTSLLDMQASIIVRNKYIIWYFYNLPTPVTNFSSTTGKLTTIQFGLGYKF